MRGDAVFDTTRRYRYRLTRSWAPGAAVAFVMLNPNLADAERDDPTIRRAIGFAKAWGFGELVVVNLFAWRCRDPRDLARVPDPIGPDNDAHLADLPPDVVVAWGNHGALRGRGADILRRLGQVACLGRTKSGHPRHPLYIRADQERILWAARVLEPPQDGER
jgi:hypothetical protein